ncbi:ATP-binding protein [Lacticaseibacillus parakribbianus]|uniref:ATP-binding protein n=1 Tax=Lacticaseibacillus parakribbianus TaxID=2970927 RepID=UPI0021CB854B|nr:ATP-binding protein [Lacticaseibacillus parakribbianus]
MSKTALNAPRRRLSLRTLIIAAIGLTVAVSLLISGIIVALHTASAVAQRTNTTIQNIGNVVRQSPVVRNNLVAHEPPQSADNAIERYTHRIQKAMKVDAVVVMNQDLIRYSHPVKAQIGQSFLLRHDAAKSRHGKAHFSKKLGVLGPEYRYFAPIYNGQHRQIGIVCITVTVKTVKAETRASLGPILLGAGIGLALGIVAAVWISWYIRRRLLGMEPDAIAAQVTELTALKESMSEGLIAIDPAGAIMQLNQVAQALFPGLEAGATLPPDLTAALFGRNARVAAQSVAIRNRELIVATTPLMAGKVNLGRLALFHDQSDYQRLVAQLAGTRQYIDALRAQQHEFMNKLQVISGLVEMAEYDKLQAFIQDVHHNYQSEFGDLNARIRLPAITGFLIGKRNEAHEQGKTLTVTKDSALPAVVGEAAMIQSDLIKVLGNLIDNALDAVATDGGTVELALNYDAESATVLIVVSDNGAGVAPTIKDQIFTPHFSTKGEGRGFGLSLVAGVVHAHHGILECDDNQPHGTVMTVELPLALPAAGEKE